MYYMHKFYVCIRVLNAILYKGQLGCFWSHDSNIYIATGKISVTTEKFFEAKNSYLARLL